MTEVPDFSSPPNNTTFINYGGGMYKIFRGVHVKMKLTREIRIMNDLSVKSNLCNPRLNARPDEHRSDGTSVGQVRNL